MLCFFVVSGMRFNLKAFTDMTKVGLVPLFVCAIVYFFARIIGKYLGAYLGASYTKRDKKIRNYLGLGLIPQAGVAIGLAAMGARLLGGGVGGSHGLCPFLRPCRCRSAVVAASLGDGISLAQKPPPCRKCRFLWQNSPPKGGEKNFFGGQRARVREETPTGFLLPHARARGPVLAFAAVAAGAAVDLSGRRRCPWPPSPWLPLAAAGLPMRTCTRTAPPSSLVCWPLPGFCAARFMGLARFVPRFDLLAAARRRPWPAGRCPRRWPWPAAQAGPLPAWRGWLAWPAARGAGLGPLPRLARCPWSRSCAALAALPCAAPCAAAPSASRMGHTITRYLRLQEATPTALLLPRCASRPRPLPGIYSTRYCKFRGFFVRGRRAQKLVSL